MVRLVPMTESEFAAYLEKTVPEYAANNVQAGLWSETDALERSQKAYSDLLPQDVKTKDNYLFRIQLEESGENIGMVWMKHETPQPQGFILDFVLDEKQRNKGYGKPSLLALEEFARKMGLKTLMLNVFTHNVPAMKLYEGLGYKMTSQGVGHQNMIKHL